MTMHKCMYFLINIDALLFNQIKLNFIQIGISLKIKRTYVFYTRYHVIYAFPATVGKSHPPDFSLSDTMFRAHFYPRV